MHKQTIYHKAYISYTHIQVNDVHAYFSPYVYSVNSYVNIVSKDFCLSNLPPGSRTVPFVSRFHKNQVSVPKIWSFINIHV